VIAALCIIGWLFGLIFVLSICDAAGRADRLAGRE